MARAVGDGLGTKLGQPVIVEPKLGADASIGTDAVGKAEPDGHAVLMATIALAVNPNLSKVPLHPVNDFEGVVHIGFVANVAAVSPSLGVWDLKSFIELARAKPGQINYVNPGNGPSPHVSAELLQIVNGIKFSWINYKGMPPAIPDFLTGTVPFGLFPFGTIAGQTCSGKAQATGIASPVRHKHFPEIPTMAEQGYAGSQMNSWCALAALKKAPRAAIERLS